MFPPASGPQQTFLISTFYWDNLPFCWVGPRPFVRLFLNNKVWKYNDSESINIEGTKHFIFVRALPIIKYLLGLLFLPSHVFWIEKYIFFTSTAFIFIIILEPLPLRFRHIFIELALRLIIHKILWRLRPAILLKAWLTTTNFTIYLLLDFRSFKLWG